MQSFASLASKAGLRPLDSAPTENSRELQIQKILSEYQLAVASLGALKDGEKAGSKVR